MEENNYITRVLDLNVVHDSREGLTVFTDTEGNPVDIVAALGGADLLPDRPYPVRLAIIDIYRKYVAFDPSVEDGDEALTADGRSVKIFSRTLEGDFPVAGAVDNIELHRWSAQGVSDTCDGLNLVKIVLSDGEEEVRENADPGAEPEEDAWREPAAEPDVPEEEPVQEEDNGGEGSGEPFEDLERVPEDEDDRPAPEEEYD